MSTVLMLYATASLILSITYIFLLILQPLALKHNKKIIVQLLQQNKLMLTLTIYSLIISRHFLSMNSKDFKLFAFFSSVLLCCFNILRFTIFCGYQADSVLVVVCIFFVYFVSFANSVIRSSIFLGNSLDSYGYTIILFNLETLQTLLRTSFSTAKHYLTPKFPINPQNAETLKYYGAAAAIVAVPVACYAAYDNHLSRVAQEISAKAAVASAKAAVESAKAATVSATLQERALDIQERNSGKMSEHIFHAKWDEYGNKRN